MSTENICSAVLTMDRQTKGAVLYKTTKDGQAVTSLYLRKDNLTQPYPASIEVTVTTDTPDAG